MIGIPLWFEMLEEKKGGNSNTLERKYVLRQVLKVIRGRPIILHADREFIGEDWVKFLLENKITFYIRLKSNTLLTYQRKEKSAIFGLGNRQKRSMDDVKIWEFRLSVDMKLLNPNAIGF